MNLPSSKSFLKIGLPPAPTTPQERIRLIRLGNECYNRKEYEHAQRIYITVKYTDGLIRLAKYYEEQKNIFEALRMYWLAGDEKNKIRISQIIARAIQLQLHRDAKEETRT